jgi:hypothetical protein
LVGKPERWHLLEDLGVVYLGEMGEGRNWIYLLTSCTTDGYYEHDTETSVSIKCGEFF